MIKKKLLMKIGKRKIGPNYKPLIIVELGINHNGSLKKAIKFVDQAKKYGAEIIKHQTHIPEDEMSIEAKNIVPSHTNENIFDIIRKSSLSEQEEYKLMKYVESKNMIFISTPFSRLAVDRLVRFKVPAFKIGSGECNNYPLIKHIAKSGKAMIISTGMNGLKSIKKAIDNGMFVGMTSQCLRGRVKMTVYSAGRNLLEIGVTPLEDMLPETALVKLMWAYGNYQNENIKEIMLKNIAGEYTERSTLGR